MTETPNNAGARLLLITRRLKELGGGNPPLIAWAMALGIPIEQSGDTPRHNTNVRIKNAFEVLHGIFETRKLIFEVDDKLSSIEGVKIERYYGTIKRLKAVADINTVMGGNFPEAVNAVSEGDVTVLEFCTDALERHYSEPVVDSNSLGQLLNELTELFSTISTLEIDADLKTFLMTRIEEMRRGVVEYQIGGHGRLKEALGKTLGMIMVNRDLILANREEPAVKGFEHVTGRLASLISFTSDVAGLVDATVKLLPGG